MIPRLGREHGLEPAYREFLTALGASGFSGDICTDYAQRLLAATDNSVYQLVPRAVVLPRQRADVVCLMRLLDQPRFREIKLSPRGGGTGTNGQALCEGIIVDVSRHMNAIIELDLEARTVRVQPGVVLDQLNAFLKPHGLFFAPNLSPSNRATIGGMISTDACGKGSRIYGKTSNHLASLDVVLLGGVQHTSRAVGPQELAELKRRPDVVGRAYSVVDRIVTEKRALIEEQFPKLQRFLTGYNLAHVRSGDGASFDLNYLLAGSEGTLGILTEACLKLTPLPEHKQLIAIKYASFDAALTAAQLLVRADPGAIETVDERILGLAREDAVWDRVRHMLEDEPGKPTRAINLVEFESDDVAVVDGKLRALVSNLDARLGQPGEAIGYHVTRSAADAAALWELRKKGVGLLGNAKGDRRPVPFVEDTAVPPERLAEYIREFRALLESHGLTYGMFGHVDVGCLHVRPALNLRDPADDKLLRRISDQVVQLVQKYGGVLWSEHGKGFRSEYSPRFFGPELFQDLCHVKAAFDPHNQLNPGKLAVPAGSPAQLISVDAVKRGHFDRQIPAPALKRYDVAIYCNGNAACFNYDADSVMCPSTKVTGDRVHSPKGRASVMREWLRQLSSTGYDTAAVHTDTRGASFFERVGNSASRRRDYDFSHEVYAAMDGCLNCKACATQCPIKVDVPRFKAEFLQAYHQRYLRPLKDYFVAALEWVLVFMGLVPRLMNWFFRAAWFKALLARVVGIVDSPLLSEQSLKRGLARRSAPRFDLAQLARLSPEARANSVILIQDAFTTFYESNVALACFELLTELGYDVYVMPFRPNGKALHVKGFMTGFERLVRDNTAYLREVAAAGIPIVGVDPAVTLTYRDEYVHALGGEAPGFRVHLLQEWLTEERPRIAARLAERGYSGDGRAFSLFGHCTEKTLEPASQRAWQEVFAAFGLKLELMPVGCCGMSGVYGHEASHYAESRGLYAMSWQRHESKRDQALAQGHSCRSQVKRFGGYVPRHPAEALVAALRAAPDRGP